MPAAGRSAQVTWKRPCLSVVTSRPLTVATRTPGKARLAIVLVAVAVLVIEDAADDFATVEDMLGEHCDGGAGRRHRGAGRLVDELCRVGVAAGGDAGRRDERQFQPDAAFGIGRQSGGDDAPPVDVRRDLVSVHPGAALHIGEARRNDVHDRCRRNRRARCLDHIGRAFAAPDFLVEHRLGEAAR